MHDDDVVSGLCWSRRAICGHCTQALPNPNRSQECSGHGRCVDIADTPSEPNALPVVDSTGVEYNGQFDSGRIFGCVCDSSWTVGLGDGEVQDAEWFGASLLLVFLLLVCVGVLSQSGRQAVWRKHAYSMAAVVVRCVAPRSP